MAMTTSLRKFRLPQILIFLLIGGQLIAIIGGLELWPFSYYPVYNWIQGPEYTYSQLYGVLQRNGEQGEIHLNARKFWYPFDDAGIVSSLSRLMKNQDPTSVIVALKATLRRYENRRDWHKGPHLIGLRFYRVKWKLSSQPPSVDEPEKIKLLAEYLEKGGLE